MNQAWWYIVEITALRRLRQEDSMFKVSLGYTGRSCVKKTEQLIRANQDPIKMTSVSSEGVPPVTYNLPLGPPLKRPITSQHHTRGIKSLTHETLGDTLKPNPVKLQPGIS